MPPRLNRLSQLQLAFIHRIFSNFYFRDRISFRNLRYFDLIQQSIKMYNIKNFQYFLLPLSNPKEQELALSKLNRSNANLRIQICTLTEKTLNWLENTPPDTKFMNPAPENVQGNWWMYRHYRQSPAIAYVESFMVMRGR